MSPLSEPIRTHLSRCADGQGRRPAVHMVHRRLRKRVEGQAGELLLHGQQFVVRELRRSGVMAREREVEPTRPDVEADGLLTGMPYDRASNPLIAAMRRFEAVQSASSGPHDVFQSSGGRASPDWGLHRDTRCGCVHCRVCSLAGARSGRCRRVADDQRQRRGGEFGEHRHLPRPYFWGACWRPGQAAAPRVGALGTGGQGAYDLAASLSVFCPTCPR